MSFADSAAHGDTTPVCPRHPGVVSYVRCQRCERPACPSCQTPAPVGVICVDCVKEANKNARPVRSRLGFTVAFGRPWVTLSLMAANIAVFVLGSVLLGSDWNFKLALWPGAAELQSQGFDLGGVAGGEWWRWITSGFVHFGFLHLALNMWVLWQFGSQLEPIMGRVRFGLLYLAGKIGRAHV